MSRFIEIRASLERHAVEYVVVGGIDVRDQIIRLAIDGVSVPVLGLEELIRQKRVLGRDKDLIALRMLEEVARQRDTLPGG